jgi:hypothetical protein
MPVRSFRPRHPIECVSYIRIKSSYCILTVIVHVFRNLYSVILL